MLAVTRRRRGRYGASEFYLPGVAGNYARTPDSAAISIVGDIDLRAKVMQPDWTPVGSKIIFSKANTDGQSSYDMFLTATGLIQIRWWPTGLNAGLISKFSTAAVPAADGTIKWVRAVLDVDNGAAGNTVTFYTSDDGQAWTQLGAQVVTAGVTSIFDGTDVLQVGANALGTANLFAGKIFYAEVRNGIGGALAAVFDPSRASAGQLDLSSPTGEKWIIFNAGSDPARLQ